MAKSIMQKRDGGCYLCQLLNDDYGEKRVECHHAIHGTANRKLSERYGLKVDLCMFHHTVGPEAVHNNAANDLFVKQMAQVAFENNYPDLDFRKIFGKSFL